MFCHKIRLQEASWAYLGPIRVAKGCPRGGLLEAKLGPRGSNKKRRNREVKKVRFRGGKKGPGWTEGKIPLKPSKADGREKGRQE